MSPLLLKLVDIVGKNHVLVGHSLEQRATSYWDSAPTIAMALVRPSSTAEVSQILKICNQHKQPVVTQGGLTGCVEGAITTARDIIISLERMKAIESIDEIGNTAIVQAGAVLQIVQETVRDKNLTFPLDLGARGSCTIGGNIATNAGGINVLRYGMMRNLVLGLETVLADGTVISSMNQMLKNNAGYDSKQLFIGSEGTLGIITRAVIRLFNQPTSCQSAMVALDSFVSVTTLLSHMQKGLAGTLSAFEVMWGEYFKGVTGANGHIAPIDREYPFYVMLEAEGADLEADKTRFDDLLAVAFEDKIIVDAVIPNSETQRRALWNIREEFEPILPAFLYDISLPIKEMNTYISKLMTEVSAFWPDSDCFVLGHIADGNLHLFIRPNIDGGDQHAECDKLVYMALEGVNGSVSAEHGIGEEKKAWLHTSRSNADIALMKQLKSTLDPKNILNRDKVFET